MSKYGPQSRKFQITINNHEKHGFTREIIIDKLQRLFPDFFAISDEIATTGTPHCHIFLYRNSPLRVRTIKEFFPLAHIEKAYGTIDENLDYLTKSGARWNTSKKSETTVPGSYFEYGERPTEEKANAPQLYEVLENLKNSKSVISIIEANPRFSFNVRELELLKTAIDTEYKYKIFREVSTSYFYGNNTSRITDDVYKSYSATNICRIATYSKNKPLYFDAYRGESILLFDNFEGQIPVQELITYMEHFPLYMRARYQDRIALYTHLILISTIPPESQYASIKRKQPELFYNFYNKIDTVIEYVDNKNKIIHKEKKNEHIKS